jgi:hypothetical protein
MTSDDGAVDPNSHGQASFKFSFFHLMSQPIGHWHLQDFVKYLGAQLCGIME